MGGSDAIDNVMYTYVLMHATIYTNLQQECLKNGNIPGFHRFILLFRNPYDAIWSVLDHQKMYNIHRTPTDRSSNPTPSQERVPAQVQEEPPRRHDAGGL